MPGEVCPSTEGLREGKSHGVYPQNRSMFEIALPAPEDAEPPPQFLDRNETVKKENLRFLPLDRCVAAISVEQAFAKVVREQVLSTDIDEERARAAFSEALRKQNGIHFTPGYDEEKTAATLAQLLIEDRIAITMYNIKKACNYVLEKELDLLSPALPVDYGVSSGRIFEPTPIGDLVISFRDELAGAKFSSGYLRRYLGMLLNEIDRRLEHLG